MSPSEKKPLPIKQNKVGDKVEVLVKPPQQDLPNEWWEGRVVPNNLTSKHIPSDSIVVEVDAERAYLVIVSLPGTINRANI